MKEKWDLYDVKRNKAGLTWMRGMAIPKGYYHLVVSVWIQNDRGEYLLSRNSILSAGNVLVVPSWQEKTA